MIKRNETEGLSRASWRKMPKRMGIFLTAKFSRFLNKTPIFILISAFLFNTAIPLDLAWAIKTDTMPSPIGEKQSVGPGQVSLLSPYDIDIAPAFGSVKERFQPDGEPKGLIVHIQDLHTHYEAHKNIRSIVDYLARKHGVNLVLCEAKETDKGFAYLRPWTYQNVREAVAEEFLKEGVLTGWEALDLAKDDLGLVLQGIEDKNLYMKDMDSFLKAEAFRPEALGFTDSLSNIAENLKLHMYSAAQKAFDEKMALYRDEKIQIAEYVTYLTALAKKNGIDYGRFGNLGILLDTLKMEEKIDFKKAERERETVIDELSKRLLEDEMKKLLDVSMKFKAGRISQHEFYQHLAALADKMDISMKRFPDLNLYTEYIAAYHKLDASKLFEEMNGLENSLAEAVFTEPNQKKLFQLSKNLSILKGLIDFKLTPDEFDYYVNTKPGFDIKEWLGFLKLNSEYYKLSQNTPSDASIIISNIPILEEFYNIARLRDEAFVNNINGQFEKRNIQTAFLMTGGFHTPGITKLLKDAGYSYVVIAPRIEEEMDYEKYHKILKDAYNEIRQRSAIGPLSARERPATMEKLVAAIKDKAGFRIATPEEEKAIFETRTAIAVVTAAGEAILSNRAAVLIEQGLIGRYLELIATLRTEGRGVSDEVIKELVKLSVTAREEGVITTPEEARGEYFVERRGAGHGIDELADAKIKDALERSEFAVNIPGRATLDATLRNAGISLDESQVALLNEIIDELGIRELLKDLVLLFIPGFGEGHYSVKWPQVYIDISLLDRTQKDKLKRQLWHEVWERRLVVDYDMDADDVHPILDTMDRMDDEALKREFEWAKVEDDVRPYRITVKPLAEEPTRAQVAINAPPDETGPAVAMAAFLPPREAEDLQNQLAALLPNKHEEPQTWRQTVAQFKQEFRTVAAELPEVLPVTAKAPGVGVGAVPTVPARVTDIERMRTLEGKAWERALAISMRDYGTEAPPTVEEIRRAVEKAWQEEEAKAIERGEPVEPIQVAKEISKEGLKEVMVAERIIEEGEPSREPTQQIRNAIDRLWEREETAARAEAAKAQEAAVPTAAPTGLEKYEETLREAAPELAEAARVILSEAEMQEFNPTVESRRDNITDRISMAIQNPGTTERDTLSFEVTETRIANTTTFDVSILRNERIDIMSETKEPAKLREIAKGLLDRQKSYPEWQGWLAVARAKAAEEAKAQEREIEPALMSCVADYIVSEGAFGSLAEARKAPGFNLAQYIRNTVDNIRLQIERGALTAEAGKFLTPALNNPAAVDTLRKRGEVLARALAGYFAEENTLGSLAEEAVSANEGKGPQEREVSAKLTPETTAVWLEGARAEIAAAGMAAPEEGAASVTGGENALKALEEGLPVLATKVLEAVLIKGPIIYRIVKDLPKYEPVAVGEVLAEEGIIRRQLESEVEMLLAEYPVTLQERAEEDMPQYTPLYNEAFLNALRANKHLVMAAVMQHLERKDFGNVAEIPAVNTWTNTQVPGLNAGMAPEAVPALIAQARAALGTVEARERGPEEKESDYRQREAGHEELGNVTYVALRYEGPLESWSRDREGTLKEAPPSVMLAPAEAVELRRGESPRFIVPWEAILEAREVVGAPTIQDIISTLKTRRDIINKERGDVIARQKDDTDYVVEIDAAAIAQSTGDVEAHKEALREYMAVFIAENMFNWRILPSSRVYFEIAGTDAELVDAVRQLYYSLPIVAKNMPAMQLYDSVDAEKKSGNVERVTITHESSGIGLKNPVLPVQERVLSEENLICLDWDLGFLAALRIGLEKETAENIQREIENPGTNYARLAKIFERWSGAEINGTQIRQFYEYEKYKTATPSERAEYISGLLHIKEIRPIDFDEMRELHELIKEAEFSI